MVDEDGKLTGLNTGMDRRLLLERIMLMLECSPRGVDQRQWWPVEDGGGTRL